VGGQWFVSSISFGVYGNAGKEKLQQKKTYGMHVVEDTVTRPLAENPHILQRILERLPRHECLARQPLVLDGAVGLERHGRHLAVFQLFCEFLRVLCDFGGQREQRLGRVLGRHGSHGEVG
jgi:hypothetical protein